MKKKLLYILYLVVFVLTVFGAVELYLSYLLGHPASCPESWKPTLIQYYREYEEKFIQQEEGMAQYDDGLFYTLKPGEFTFENREFSTPYLVNSLGVRDDEESLKEPKIVMLGDSYGMGWGTHQEKSYAQLVEKELKLKVLNAGISSYGTPRELELLKRIDTDSMEYLVIQYCSNDNYEITEYVKNDHQLKVSSEQVYDSICDLVQSRNGYYPFKYVIGLLPQLISPSTPESNHQSNHSTKDTISISNSFLELLKNCHEIPPNVNVILFTLDEKGFENWFMEEVQRILNKSFGSSLHDRVHFLNFSDDLTTDDYYVLDVHINEKGHQLVADSIVNFIRSSNHHPYQKQFLYDNGSVCINASYINHIKNGPTTYYWENGVISQTTSYNAGLKHGEEIRYNKEGEEVERKFYINGMEVRDD